MLNRRKTVWGSVGTGECLYQKGKKGPSDIAFLQTHRRSYQKYKGRRGGCKENVEKALSDKYVLNTEALVSKKLTAGYSNLKADDLARYLPVRLIIRRARAAISWVRKNSMALSSGEKRKVYVNRDGRGLQGNSKFAEGGRQK